MKEKNRSQRTQMVGLLVGVSMLVLLVAQACLCCPPPTPTPTTEVQVTPTEIVRLKVDAQIRRRLARVWAGPGDATLVPELDDEAWYDLEAGSLVTTDDSGEGWVQFTDCDMRIYIFRNSKLRKSACPKSSLTGGNVTCAEEGTSAFNNRCASKVIIQTPSMQVELEGTWLMVSYLPDQQLSVVQVWEGLAKVWPVLDAEDYRLDAAFQMVNTGESYLTVPDARLGEMGDLPVRTPLDTLPPEIQELFQPWTEQALARAQEHGVSPPSPPAAVESFDVFLLSGGGPLDDPRVREAIQYAVPWEALAQEVFPNQDVPILIGSVPEGMTTVKPENMTVWEVPDARNVDYDPERAEQLLAEAGYPDGFPAAFFFPGDDEELAFMAGRIADSLGKVGIGIDIERDSITLAEAITPVNQLVAEMVNEGTPVLWLGRR